MTPGVSSARSFVVSRHRIAHEPPEQRGSSRDRVRLLIATPRSIAHRRFDEIGTFLRPGDLLVVNTSSTRPGAIDGIRDNGGPVVVHLSSERARGVWDIELRRTDGAGPVLDGASGERIHLTGGAVAELRRPSRPDAPIPRLWRAAITSPGGSVHRHMNMHGRPITYGSNGSGWPLEAYQTVFARHPGSAEMASAGRPFSVRLVTELMSLGVMFAPITLHAGVSSPETGEPPGPEWFSVPPVTASLVNLAASLGRRVIAIGTTATRAIESAATPERVVIPATGWTDLVLDPDRPTRVVDGLVTGWHESGASHLSLLDAVAGSSLVDAAYTAALAGEYLWHEFGDSCLLLPDVD